MSVATNQYTTRSQRREMVAFGVVALIASAIAAYTAISMINGAPKAVVLLPLAVALGTGLAGLALVNFEAFLLVVLSARTALDALKVNAGTQLADPAAAVGLLLLVMVPLWLLLQHRLGALRFRLTGTGIAVGFFGIAALAGVIVSASPANSAAEWTRIAAAIAMFFAIEQLALARGGFKWRAVAAMFLAVPVPVIYAAAQVATGDGLFEAGGFERVTGSFTHSNPFAAFLVIAILMALAVLAALPGRRRGLALAVIVMAAPALLLTYTRGAWIALIVGALLIGLVLRRASIIAGLLVAGIAVALLIPSVGDRFSTVTDVSAEESYGSGQDSLAWRVDYWQRAMGLSHESPVVGIGLKQIAETLPEAKQPHNDFVRAYVELGVLGAGRIRRDAGTLPRDRPARIVAAAARTRPIGPGCGPGAGRRVRGRRRRLCGDEPDREPDVPGSGAALRHGTGRACFRCSRPSDRPPFRAFRARFGCPGR